VSVGDLNSYVAGCAWERHGEAYRRLGVRAFRPFAAGGRFWQRLGLASRAATWRRSNAQGYVRQSVVAEVAHVASLGFLALVAGLMLLRGQLLAAAVVSLVNGLINLLPIAVLRYNRLRLLRHRRPGPSLSP
jgi:hypothetical protein